MLLQANQESSTIAELSKTNLWHPWSNTKNLSSVSSPVSLSTRAQQIAKSKEEMMGLLKDMPESDYELSLTDLVEKKSAKEDEISINDQQKNLTKDKKDWRKKRSSSSSRSSSFRSSSDGVLLNFFMPVSLTRSLTTPRQRRGVGQRGLVDCSNRETELASARWKGCWPAFLKRRRDKSKDNEM